MLHARLEERVKKSSVVKKSAFDKAVAEREAEIKKEYENREAAYLKQN